MKALHFGAGNIGKGFIGYLLNKTGYEVLFVDVNKKTINHINKTNKYFIEQLDDNQTLKEVSPVFALNAITQKQEIIDAIFHTNLITTSVGINNFPTISELIAQGLIRRKSKIDVIANENSINASSKLKKEVMRYVPENEKDFINSNFGFPNTVVDRVVISKDDEKETVLVEPYYEWIINRSEIVNSNMPCIKDVLYKDDLKMFIERKLYIVNMGHAAVAYIGYWLGKDTIQEVLADQEVKKFVREVLEEGSRYFIHEFCIDKREMKEFITKTINRFSNKNIKDDIFRVGRDPIRKLNYNDRIIGLLEKLFSLNLSINYLSFIAALVFLFSNPDDKESVTIQEYIHENGIHLAVTHFTGIENINLKSKIIEYYFKIKESNQLNLYSIIKGE